MSGPRRAPPGRSGGSGGTRAAWGLGAGRVARTQGVTPRPLSAGVNRGGGREAGGGGGGRRRGSAPARSRRRAHATGAQ